MSDSCPRGIKDIHLHSPGSALSLEKSLPGHPPPRPSTSPSPAPTYLALGPQAGLGVGPLLPIAVRGAGPAQSLLALQAADALHVHVERLIRTEHGLENVLVSREQYRVSKVLRGWTGYRENKGQPTPKANDL